MNAWALHLTALMLLAVAGCAGSSPVVSGSAGVQLDPHVAFDAIDGGTLALEGLAETDTKSPRLLVLRIVASWCGTCRWSASHTSALLADTSSARVRFVDLLVRSDANAPATRADLERWREGSDGVAEVAGDPQFQLAKLFEPRSALPLFAFIDTRSLTVLATLSHPTPDATADAIRAGLAQMAGEPKAAWFASELHDGLFTSEEWDMIQAMALPARALPDPSNAVADDPGASLLGGKLFFDSRLSPAGVSCASCHVPDLVFTDGKETPPEGVGKLERNAPTILLASDQTHQFWDGRADSLWMQALAPFESPVEFGSSRLFAMRQVFKYYRAEYETLFGSLAAFETPSRFPESGGPGDAAWEALADSDRAFVTRAFVNVGKAIAAYERSLRPAPNALDAYANGDLGALSQREKDGIAAFFRAGCAECHYGPRLSDDSFHNLRFPTGRHDRAPDMGQRDGAGALNDSEFNRGESYSDAPGSFVPAESVPSALGAFKTPGLRGVAFTLPYGHGGSYWGLTSVIEAHQSGGLPATSPFTIGELEPFSPTFDVALTPQIVAFLASLTLELEP